MAGKPEFEVVGRSSADAVVTVNGRVAGLDEDGRFEATFALEEGSNVVDAVASTDSGHELSEALLLTYDPDGDDENECGGPSHGTATRRRGKK